MRFARLIVATLSTIGLLAILVPNVLSQQLRSGATALSGSDAAEYQNWQQALPVRAVLDQFNYALAMHDVGMLQAAGVKRNSARLWQRFFTENPRATVSDSCPVSALFISYDRAYWTCTETATIISEGKPKPFLHVIHFTFVRKSGMWLVADRR